MTPNFLLQTATARSLYHEVAAPLPIIDYHCHLDPAEIAADHRFESITELWLAHDHYKWRAMRWNGIDEHYITGSASDWDKFRMWAQTVDDAMRNPLYHWTHLELHTAFGIDTILSPETARQIFDRCNELLRQPQMSACQLMLRYRVETVCTTDDPADTLQHHQAIARSGFPVRVLPTWRPDRAMAIEDPTAWRHYIERLGASDNTEIRSWDDLLEVLQHRHDFFHRCGCRLSDHGISRFYADDFTESQLRNIFRRALDGHAPTPDEACQFRSALLLEFARQDARSGWTQQFHYGPLRNTNSLMMQRLGPDSGFDSIGTPDTTLSLARFLDRLYAEGSLAQTILYPINPSDLPMLATMIGNFQQGPVPGKLQLGSAWWFMDQRDGIEQQLNTLSQLGLLSRFVGMLTDSRSFLSYPRHEYFRRILCNLLGNDVEQGLLPASRMDRIRQMVRDICYENARRYFRF